MSRFSEEQIDRIVAHILEMKKQEEEKVNGRGETKQAKVVGGNGRKWNIILFNWI